MEKQRTIKKEAKVSGVGIHTGKKVELTFKPAAPDTGIMFRRCDLPGSPEIHAVIASVLEKSLQLRRTSLGNGRAEVHTVEHLLSALFGAGIDNIIVEINSEEVPALNGGASEFHRIFSQAGIIELAPPKNTFTVREPLWLGEGDSFLSVFPDEQFRISYTLSYPKTNLHQYLNLVINEQSYTKELAPCKTFCLESEIEQLRKQGLGKGATTENTIVVGKNGVVKGTPTFPDEFARHKVLDLIGDFCLLAPAIKGHVVAVKSGHTLNIKFLQKLSGLAKAGLVQDTAKKRGTVAPPFDIEKIMAVLPHRYPFLLVDRAIEFSADQHITCIKNVTINEQFFTGHFPGRPVMPGVLIIEAMAQAAGILMLSRQDNRGKLAYFMTMDNVKFRKTVIPGDQLVLDIDVVRIKSRMIQIRGQALVDGKTVAEADLMFTLVPKNE
ncbi:MAG: bifunctional UDP-3-O-[3-hydroxymyristoyl] N-acetylglucosamine deacetylase/3-hydroxyacyl-ACP dehydratase [Candidatus Omnitrophota bacterium]